jgi:hypothetical protein
MTEDEEEWIARGPAMQDVSPRVTLAPPPPPLTLQCLLYAYLMDQLDKGSLDQSLPGRKGQGGEERRKGAATVGEEEGGGGGARHCW